LSVMTSTCCVSNKTSEVIRLQEESGEGTSTDDATGDLEAGGGTSVWNWADWGARCWGSAGILLALFVSVRGDNNLRRAAGVAGWWGSASWVHWSSRGAGSDRVWWWWRGVADWRSRAGGRSRSSRVRDWCDRSAAGGRGAVWWRSRSRGRAAVAYWSSWSGRGRWSAIWWRSRGGRRAAVADWRGRAAGA
jgi:hypothetical protein